MVKIMMAAPFAGEGRNQGGICTVVNGLMSARALWEKAGLQIIPFNTCRKTRTVSGEGKLSLENLQNFYRNCVDSIKQLRREPADIFYIHSSVMLALVKDAWILRRVKKKIGCKTVLHIHSADENMILTGNKLLDNWTVRAIQKNADVVVVLSRQILETMVQLGIDRKKCRLLYNYMALDEPATDVPKSPEGAPLDLLFMGVIREEKGILDLLEVLKQVEKPFTMHLCGTFWDTRMEEAFESCRQVLGDKLRYHGFVAGDEKEALFRNADVLVLPSYSEGLPMVVLEAFGSGCGVIATEVGALPEIVTEENGILIKPGDREALLAALETYLSMDSEQLHKQKMRNLKMADQFTLDQFVEGLAQICREV